MIKFETVYGKEGPYLTRLILGRLRLHCFHRGDEDEETHSHPWDFWTFPLVGYYEDVLTFNGLERAIYYGGVRVAPYAFYTRRQFVRPFRWHKRDASHSHRILYSARDSYGMDINVYRPEFRHARSKNIYTIVWTGRRAHTWGFNKLLENGMILFTHWRLFIQEKGLKPVERKAS